MDRVYLDHFATTACRAEVWEAMRSHAVEYPGNASAIHSSGRRARAALEDARERIAGHLGISSHELTFTSGATESIDLALRGVTDRCQRGHIVVSRVEHPAVLRTCAELEREGREVSYVDVDRYGSIDQDAWSAAVRPDTVLVSFSHVQDEVGTVQLVSDLIARARKINPRVAVHLDAVGSVGQMPIHIKELDVDLLTFTAHKFYGPRGIGGLVVRDGTELTPQLVGGNQEGGRRAGTEAVPLAVGMALALDLAAGEMQTVGRWASTRSALAARLLQRVDDCRVNGHPTECAPTILSLSFMGVVAEDLVLQLDRAGIEGSSGTACMSGRLEPSATLLAMGYSRGWALGALRLSFGRHAQGLDVEEISARIARAVGVLRSTHYRGAALVRG